MSITVTNLSKHYEVHTKEAGLRGSLAAYGEVQRLDGLAAELSVERAETTRVGARLLAELPVADVNIAEPPIEEIISEVFAGPVAPA